MDTLRQLTSAWSPLALESLKLSFGLVFLLIVFLPLEKVFSVREQSVFRKGFFIDLSYYYVNSLLTHRLLILPMSLLAWLVHHFYPINFHTWVGSLSLPIRFSAALIVGEIGFYWGHRMMHEIPFLWRFHAIHHSAEQLDWLVNTRAHPIDMVLIRLSGFIPMYLLGLAQPLGNQLDLIPMLVTLISNTWGFFIHSNIRWRLFGLEYCIATPAFHHWHHSNDGAAFINKNYAALLPAVDKLFGSFYLPKQRPQQYGISEKMPNHLLKQLYQPFIRK